MDIFITTGSPKNPTQLKIVLLTVADDAAQGVSFKVKLDVHVLPLKPKSNR